MFGSSLVGSGIAPLLTQALNYLPKLSITHHTVLFFKTPPYTARTTRIYISGQPVHSPFAAPLAQLSGTGQLSSMKDIESGIIVQEYGFVVSMISRTV